MKPIIEVQNLSKQYTIGEKTPYGSLREEIMQALASPFRRKTPSALRFAQSDTTIWALKDVSFTVNEGEVVGIIGRNGAGKSTLLKILSRITEPTNGKITMRGRIASLLEVGTGFHPELTGRENIFLNGSLLGMRNTEIREKFDEIVAFSEIEKFLDTPVKRYSSGMYVRLAFAVAAHLEPEILVIDEVLAVGDAQFQKKCLGKMGEVAKSGRTVLFVSHNMQAVRNLCSRCILLDRGVLVSNSTADETLNVYSRMLRDVKIDIKTELHNERVRRGSGAIRFSSVEVLDGNGNRSLSMEMGDTMRFRLSYKVFKEMEGLAVYIGLHSGLTRELVTSVRHIITRDKIAGGTEGTVTVELPDIYIRPGEYPIYLQISDAETTQGNFEVLDDMINPLVIIAGKKVQHTNFDPSRHGGYFSLPSRIALNEINKRQAL